MPTPTHRAQSEAREAHGPTRDYIEQTRAFWQPYAERDLTREDAREMAHNLLGFFTVLREWSIKERERSRLGITPPRPAAARKRGRPRKLAAAENEMQS